MKQIADKLLFLTIQAINKNIKSKRKSDNHIQNSLRLFDSLANFPFTTSEAKYDLLITWYIPVALQVAKHLKTYDLTRLVNMRKISKLS